MMETPLREEERRICLAVGRRSYWLEPLTGLSQFTIQGSLRQDSGLSQLLSSLHDPRRRSSPAASEQANC